MVAVMGQPKWEEVVSGIIDAVLDDIHARGGRNEGKGVLVSLYCRKGMHRSDVSARWLASALASLQYMGSPLLDVQLFPLSECLNKKDKQHTVGKAVEWAQSPWPCAAPMVV